MRDFLSDAAHELRTPIAGVHAAAEHLLRDDPPRAEREQSLVALVRESRRAGRLVDDMLTMARIDSGLSLRRTTVDLRDVVQEAVDALGRSRPGLLLGVTGGAVPVQVDRDRITQIVGNLLGWSVLTAPAPPLPGAPVWDFRSPGAWRGRTTGTWSTHPARAPDGGRCSG